MPSTSTQVVTKRLKGLAVNVGATDSNSGKYKKTGTVVFSKRKCGGGDGVN